MLSVKRESLSNSLKNISANLWRHVAHIALLVGIAQPFATSSVVPLLRVGSMAHYIAAVSIRLPSCWILPPCCHAMGPPIFRRQTSGTNNAHARVGPPENFFAKFTPVGGTMLENRSSTRCAPFRAGFLCYAFSVGRATAHRRNHCRRWTTCRRSAKA